MQRLLRLLFLFSLTALIAGCGDDNNPAEARFRGNPISGAKTGVLDLTGSPYLVVDSIWVPDGQVLRIDPGVEIRFDEPKWIEGHEIASKINVEGTLIARGTANMPITFTSGREHPARGDWDGIWLLDADEGTMFEYCRFFFGAKYGRRYHYRQTGGGQLDSSLYEYGSVTMFNSSPTIRKCLFFRGGFHGAHCDSLSEPIIENCNFYDNAGHGIFVQESAEPIIRYNIISENDDYGVYCRQVGENAPPRADLNLRYNIVWSNFSGEFNQNAPTALGRIAQVNENLDSCDYKFNLRLNPSYIAPANLNFALSSASAAIDAGPSGLDAPHDPDGTRIELGIESYRYRPGELRRRITIPRLEASKSPYYMSYDALLPRGQTLVVEPGVEVRVEGRYSLRVMGRLESAGTAAAPVRFVSALPNPMPGSWIGILYNAENNNECDLNLTYTTISHARWGVSISQGDPTIQHCVISFSDSVGILCHNQSSPTITDTRFENNAVASVLCQFNSSPLIQRCRIVSGAGYGVYVRESSRPRLYNNVITGVAVDGIRLENLSDAVIINNTIVGNGYFGIYCQNNSSPDVRNNIFAGNGDLSRGGVGLVARLTSLPVIQYNCFWDHVKSSVSISGSTALDLLTNLQRDPMFVNIEAGDFHLKAGSPCRGAGDPTIKNADNSPSDLGAYGGPGAGQ